MEKCILCERKGKMPCLTHGESLICRRCCKSNQSWAYCNVLCGNFPEEEKENLFEFRMSHISLTMDNGETIRLPLKCFLSNIYEFVTCIVKNLNIKFLNSQTISIEVTFNLKSDRISEEIYFKERWKKEENWGSQEYLSDHHMEYLYDYHPLFFVFTENINKVYPLKTELEVDGSSLDFTDSNVHWTVGLPCSNIKSKTLRRSGENIIEEYINGSGFLGRNYSIFSPIPFNKDLKLKFVISRPEMNIDPNLKLNFPLKLFFPFKNVIVEDINYIIPPGFELIKDPSITLYNPTNTIKLHQGPDPEMIEDISYSSTENLLFSNKINLDSYKILELSFEYMPKVEKEALSFVTTYPIPSSIYNSIYKLHSEKFAPAIVIVSNYSDHTISASITAEIEGISNVFENDIVIGSYSQEIVRITPNLNVDVIEKLHDIMDTSMRIKVESEGKPILRRNESIQVLARDTMIWEIEDPGKSWTVDLSKLVVSWITPHTPAVDKVISSAARKIGAMGAFNNDSSMTNEIKAIYDTISEDIRYVSRHFSFRSNEHVSTQRILSPKQTLSENSGNCIDLSVLFASCLENIDIKPLIVITPDHAFVGWKSFSSPSSFIFLEATFMGESDFFSAVEYGTRTYEKYNQDNPGDIEIIDVEEIRGKGVYPPRWFS
ncbi:MULTISPECIES: transglutaminase-like domain-containing protein [Methanobacterium]|uniref:Transglutaminase-like domain-containing protein n=1 Tax=Methanobacterium bryantii TaxID=2161 RepID=A0A2A2H8A8_METBR|nr:MULTISPECIES: transglutaminase-like domain-containing protein [Methanobacterium]OEC84387.1 hypothetical protein A9507_02280 [Methanobacterium sp. A39]PAV05617.1 hypothetical protein ASJ80_08900 [Methanobacterium bryantii]